MDKFTGLKKFIVRNSRLFLTVGGLLLILYVFIPQLGDLKDSLRAVRDADAAQTLLAVIVFCIGFPIIALKYVLIAQYFLDYLLSLRVQIASAFVSKLLPMSIGSLTVNTYYLTHESKSAAKAASTMAFNALTSSLAFGLIVIVGLIGCWSSFSSQGIEKNVSWFELLSFIILAVLAVWGLLKIHKLRMLAKQGLNSLWLNFQTYKKGPLKATWGILFNGLGSLTGITTLYICCRAVGLPVAYSQAIVTYTLGNVVGSLVPTPGGLGGVEAGLYSGLVFFNYDQNIALVAVCLYRLISYWLPIIPGYFSYRRLRKTVFINFKLKPGSA